MLHIDTTHTQSLPLFPMHIHPFSFFEIEGRHANVKAQEVVDHLTSLC